MNDLPFHTLLYRYFFAGWLFLGPPAAADPLSAALDAPGRQRRQAEWLPTYVLRWFVCAGILCLAGFGAELALEAPVASQLLYAGSMACIAYASYIASTWVRLRTTP